MDKARQKLDELFGKDRDLPLKERFESKEHYDDLDVCKYNLVSFCPHDLFPNTKNDLGEYLSRIKLDALNVMMTFLKGCLKWIWKDFRMKEDI